jgi:hypothetical protein
MRTVLSGVFVVATFLGVCVTDASACEPDTRFSMTVPGPGGYYGFVEYVTYDSAKPKWLNYETSIVFGGHQLLIPLPAPLTGGLFAAAIGSFGWLGYGWTAARRHRGVGA